MQVNLIKDPSIDCVDETFPNMEALVHHWEEGRMAWSEDGGCGA